MRNCGVTIFWDASHISASGTTVFTRNAKGDVSFNQAVSQTVFYEAGLDCFKRVYYNMVQGGGNIGTYLTSNEFQEAFGSTPASPGAPGPGNPWSGGATAAQFQQGAFPFGIQIVDVFAWYSVTTASLSAGSQLGLARTTYTANGTVALAAVDIVAPTAVTLTTTSAAADPQRFLAPATQPLVYESSDLQSVQAELTIITPGTGTARVYAMGVHGIFSFD